MMASLVVGFFLACVFLGSVTGMPVDDDDYYNFDEDFVEEVEEFVAGPPITSEELKHKLPRQLYRSNRDDFIPWEKQRSGLLEGDIIPRLGKNALISTREHWPNSIIPYVIDTIYTSTERQIIAFGMNEYHTKTCIRFVPRTTQTNYIRITKSAGGGCSSYVGLINRGMQEVNLSDGCIVPYIVIHELMHAAGFHHEQTRPDRNTYVFVNLTNVPPGIRGNFNLLSASEYTTFGLPYDYGSVMHYGRYDFAIDRKVPVITARNGDPAIAIRKYTGFSDLDVQKVNKLCSKSRPPG